MVGARKKWRATTSQVTESVMGTISQAVTIPVQSASRSSALTTARKRGPTPACVGSTLFSVATWRLHRDDERPGGGARGPRRRPGPRSGLLQPDLVLVVVLGDEVVVGPVRQAVGHDETGVLLLRVDDLLVEVVLGRVGLPDLVVRLQEAAVQVVR